VINWFIPLEHNIHKHQHPRLSTCFGPFLDHYQAKIYL
jgi:hypothetical protein